MTVNDLIKVAAVLASDRGENVEYDRALVELCASFLPGDSDHAKAYLYPLIVREV